MKAPRHILITGASSGIGEALALAYAAPEIRLALHGRHRQRLEQVAAAARAQGAIVTIGVGDVTDRDAMQRWVNETDAACPVDLVIANAGISTGTGNGGETEQQAREVFAVNVDGVLNTVHPLIPRMIARKRGQIAIMASLAGFRGLPGAPSYCASKAAVRLYGEGLRGEVGRHGVEVSVVCPGYIRTPMTNANEFPMPFLMGVGRAAALIQAGLAQNRPRIAFPLPMYALVWLLALLPPAWTDGVLARLPKKARTAKLAR